MLLAPYRASQTAPCGCIEMVAPGANGVLWVVGWARRDQARAFAAAILDRRKYRAGGLVAGFDREDLGAEASGFVGVLRTDWRPSPGREAILQIDGENGGQLRAIRALRLGRVRDALAHLERAASGEDGALAQPLLAFARANEDLDLAPNAGSRVKLAVDSAAVMEGFGVFMKGWIFSPMQRVKRLYLKLGDRQVEAEPQSLGFSPRPDLLSAFPHARESVNRAGFCCVFPHDGAVALHAEAGLRIVYEDGGASFHPLPDVVIRRLQPDDEGGQYREFYPHMERQPLFAAYARAYYAQCEARYGQCSIEASEPAPIQLVFVAPRERNRLYLMFEELRQNLRRRRARGVGVVIVAGKAAGHGEIRELFHGLSRDFAGPCSLVLVEDPRLALWSLDGALVALGARRFVFVAAEVTLDDRGWEAMAGLLAAEPRLAFLDVSDPCEAWTAPQASMQAFVWTSEAFLDWRRQRRLPLGKAPAGESEEDVGEWRSACGVIERQAPPTAAIEAINFHAGAL